MLLFLGEYLNLGWLNFMLALPDLYTALVTNDAVGV